ncbi:diaminopimelate decarboxylase [Phycicoccus endophyticus]|uniref:Diaminopimelate decarboxylase n=1 Tax=Phycicoccus endophyticus TaxID=1690220 RepID=A0A7G9QYM0_9MICO|nr:diaminopimelate decarboxylase [Phycicoccus endophyticus]NHI19350.1 diaminopimelate decarboxylase [Phycicoccus endophyticus]QNN48445.1 diaminopimelate decarboxylase [Phycicoccus endophyticus]GGL42064.1 diaminopimelate decarboxylase [Phycicoccus endophyticus]
MRAHEAGALHAEGYGGPPLYLPYPSDVMELLPQLWPASVGRDDRGRLTVAGVDVCALAERHGTAAYVMDEDDFRSRARDFRDSFASAFAHLGGADVYYAGKAFLCTAVARWVQQEGLCLDVCTGGELAVARRVGFPAERVAFHGNNKTVPELREALEYGVGRIVVDSFDEIERVIALATELGVRAPVMVRVTVGVEAHTHEFIATGHEDQKFGFSLAGGQAMAAVARLAAHPEAVDLRGLHSHIGSQIFDTAGFEAAVHRLAGLHAAVATEHGIALPELDLGGGYGVAYTSQHTPLPPRELARSLAEIVERELAAGAGAGHPAPRVSVEPGRAIVGPTTFTLYEVGTVKHVDLGGGHGRTYVSVDGGMSDNARPALYEADYSCTLANRSSSAEPTLARVVGRHCESGDIVVLDEYLPADVRPGDLVAVPGTGAYCRSLSSQYNHTPRPPVVAVREGESRVIVRRETIDDLLALDVADA